MTIAQIEYYGKIFQKPGFALKWDPAELDTLYQKARITLRYWMDNLLLGCEFR